MARFEKVEDIEAWREAKAIAVTIYKLTSTGPWARDYGLRDQIRRACVSIACNIAEGFARETQTEFCRFLAIARGSAAEAKTQMYIALEIGYVDKQSFDAIYAQLDKVCRMITGLMQYLKARASSKPSTVNR